MEKKINEDYVNSSKIGLMDLYVYLDNHKMNLIFISGHRLEVRHLCKACHLYAIVRLFGLLRAKCKRIEFVRGLGNQPLDLKFLFLKLSCNSFSYFLDQSVYCYPKKSVSDL